ncbi:MAG: hypothetical protein MRQ09_03125 [Candidatus Midichloria sp.]|nr:hypothetical protein [Candidatus Midichloria sp.]
MACLLCITTAAAAGGVVLYNALAEHLQVASLATAALCLAPLTYHYFGKEVDPTSIQEQEVAELQCVTGGIITE